MTVNETIERLQEAAEDGFGECELRLAFQPNWLLQFTIGGGRGARRFLSRNG